MSQHWPKVQKWQGVGSMIEALLGLLQQSPPQAETKFSRSLLSGIEGQESLLQDDQPQVSYDNLAPRPQELNPQIDGLARLLISEADGESLAGKQAVANVVVNRVNTNKYGFKNTDDVLKSISKPGEFESYNNKAYKNASKSKNWDDAVKIATAAYQGRLKDITGGSLYFRNPNIRDAKRKEGQEWFDRRIGKGVLVPYSTIGNHEFYRQVK